MAIKPRMNFAHMISAHVIPEGLHVAIHTFEPGRFDIPSRNDNPKRVKRAGLLAVTDHSTGAVPVDIRVQFAEIQKCRLGPYVYLTIPDCTTRRIGYEQQTADERGNRLSPPIARTLLPVFAANVANEIERQVGRYGVTTIEADEPTDKEIAKVFDIAAKWQIAFINETSRNRERYGNSEITPLAQDLANDLFTRKLIPALPAWAVIRASELMKENESLACQNCGTVLRPGAASCPQCHAIRDWEKALDFGIVKLSDVPPKILAELGYGTAEEKPKA